MISKKANILFILTTLIFFLCSSLSFSQEIKNQDPDPIKKYDEIIESNSIGETEHEIKEITPKDELALFLPNLESPIYKGWTEEGTSEIWEADRESSPSPLPYDLLTESKAEKVLRQSYKKEENLINIFVYKFSDYLGTYSAFTFIREGNTAKLKAGKETYESESSLCFWKGRYLVNIKTIRKANEGEVKGFSVLAAQEISEKLKKENDTLPILAIQMPALNRIKGSEKYCLGPVCYNTFFPACLKEIDPVKLEIIKSGGVYTANYKPSENSNYEENTILLLVRYEDKLVAKSVFDFLNESYTKIKNENKEINTDLKGDILRIKINKKNYTLIKQKGNLLAIACEATDKKPGEKLLGLVPWPVEITRP